MTVLITAALAMAAPIAYGVATHHLAHASFAALGALALSTPNFVHPPTIRRSLSWLVGAQSRAGVGVVVTGAAMAGAWLVGRCCGQHDVASALVPGW
jgi:hypothetical protein